MRFDKTNVIIIWSLIIMAVNARRKNQIPPPELPNDSGSGQNYLRQTEDGWQGQWFTGSCKL